MKSNLYAFMAFCMLVVVSASPALASDDYFPVVDSVRMDPVDPEVWDDLVCSTQASSSTGDLSWARFQWIRNGVGIRVHEVTISGVSESIYDTLSSEHTDELDTIVCEVTVWDNNDNHDSDSVSVRVRESSRNNPPVIQGIPDQELGIGETFELDLWDFSFDVEDPNSALTYNIDSQANEDIIQMWISGNRFIFTNRAEQLGATSATIRVTDSQGAWDTDTFLIRVVGDPTFPDNEPPAIDFIDIDPSLPDPQDDLACEIRASDDDGNLDNVEFKWYIDGDLERTRVMTLTGFVDNARDELDSGATDEGQDVRCFATVEDKDGEEDTASETVTIEDDDPDDSCRIVIRDLEVEDNEDIEFRLRNDGDHDAEVDYEIFVDGDRVERDSVDVDEGDSESVSFRYDDFEGDERYIITVEADAECDNGGDDRDDATITYFAFGDCDDCDVEIRDLEVEDDEDIMFRIRNDGDFDAEVDYEIFVDGDRVERDSVDVDEGDSERIRFRYFYFEEGERYRIRVEIEYECDSDCDGDDEESIIFYAGGGSDCDSEWLDSYRCSGDWQQRRFRTSDCDLEWKNYKHCTDGCSGGYCVGEGPDECEFIITDFDFSRDVPAGDTGFMRVTFRNTGDRTEDFDTEFFLDSNLLGIKSARLSLEESETQTWNFLVPTSGEHVATAVVTAECGTSKARSGTINSDGGTPGPGVCNYNGVCEPQYGENWFNCAYDCEKPTEPSPTTVTISPRSFDVTQYKSKVITIQMFSSQTQDFSIVVEGVPQSWLSYSPLVQVTGSKQSFVFVNPKDTGSYDIVVRVKADTEGLTWNQPVDMYVAPSQGTPVDGGGNDPIQGILGNVWLIIFIIIIIAVVAGYFAWRSLKEEEVEQKAVEGKLPDNYPIYENR